jgi:hypothetical protein
MADKPSAVVNPTPRQKFQTIPSTVSAHRELMQNPQLNFSIDMALMEMQRRQANVADKDVTGAATNHFKIQGALEFVEILRHLGETATLPPRQTQTQQLKY